jgi:hypothetical protein
MKRISVVKTGQVTVSTSGTNLTEAFKLAEEARVNRTQVIEGALSIENQLNAVILHYFFGSVHERCAVFEALVLNSDWCSFAAKRKLITHIIDEQNLLEGRDKSDFDKLMRDVMSARNAFAHGKLSSDEKRVWLSFFEGRPRKVELTDEYLTDIETLLRAAFDKTFALAVAIGATKITQTPMPRCTHVPQDYPGGHCLSACLQSFLIDNDKSPPSQKEMLDQAKAHRLCGPTVDFVLGHNIEKFCALFGIDVEEIRDGKIPKDLANGEGILIGCWNYNDAGEHHCVRFCEYVSAEKFRVMNPAAGNAEERFREMETTQIAQWKCNIFKIRLKR